MSRKNDLLSIGELSKLTGAGIKSLRYYERIKLLKPAYISPDSGYRYYTIDQTHIVGMIMFCIELDIPLSEMTKFIDTDGVMDYRKFFREGEAVASRKMKALKKGVTLIKYLEQQMNLAEKYQVGQIYSRDIEEKTFHIRPCGTSLKDIDQVEVFRSFSDMPEPEDAYDFLEYGFLCRYSSEGVMYYAFVEVPKTFATKDTMLIPKGTYLCIQDKNTQIEHTLEIFKGRMSCPFLAIETEILTSKQKTNQPLHELRVI